MPQYRSPFSKHTFTQPSLLAILCLMRSEDWTYRETEVRLREHAELREAVGIDRVPDYTTLYRCLRRLEEDDVARLLRETRRRMPPPPDGGTTVAIDATGLASGAISTFFVHRVRDRGEGFTWRHWLKWVVVVDLPRQIILAQEAKRGPTNDGARLRPLLARARHLAPIRRVLADGEFPDPSMYDIAKLEQSRALRALLWNPDRVLPALYELRNRGLITNFSEIDTVRQLTTRLTLDEAVAALTTEGWRA